MLALFFAGLLAFIVIMYVLLDGFDLGIGILFLFTQSERERDRMMNSIAPVWDGNETWLVFGGAILYGAFPMVYGALLPVLYIPLMMMLIALIFRGVSFEFRFKAATSKPLWNWIFTISSIIASFFQGVVLGCFVQGFKFNAESQLAETVQWLTPFSLLTGIALVCGYALLGATWMIIKSEGKLQEKMAHYAKGLLVIVGLFLIFISLWMPLHHIEIYTRWYSVPNVIFLSLLPITCLIAVVITWKSLAEGKEKLPFIGSVVIFLCSYAGIGISVFPYLIPYKISFWQAAAPDSTLYFLLWGVVIMVPILSIYTLYAYYIFRGKSIEDWY